MADLDALLAGLDADQRVRGRGFERLCRWVLENAPEYAAKLEKVWLWEEWPGREGRRDAGIDVVALDRDGGLWAVQAKHYDPAYAIKKADLDSFLSESSRAEFVYRLLIATTDHLGPTARRTLDGQEKSVGTLLRSDLEVLNLPWPHSLAALRPARPKPKRPRPHQRRAVKDIVRGLETNERGQAVMACGTGKTLVARFLHDQVASCRTLVLVPSLSLLKQSLREWLAVGAFDYLAVCSDDTVAPDDTDAMVSTTTELGVPVTTDAALIAAFLRKRGYRVVFATYQSSQRIAEAQAGGAPGFDLVIADEAHRCAGPQAGVFATVLDAKRIKARRRVFMTATPRRFTGRVQREALEADWEVASMDDASKFGPVLHRLNFAQAIDQELLSDYQVVVVGVNESHYREMAERAAFVTTEGQTVTDARTLARQIGLLRAMRNHDLHRVVSFHSRISNASRFARDVVDVAAWMPSSRRPTGRLWTDHVSGRMTSGERETKLNRLREVGEHEHGLLSNARCLSEGVDVPTLDGVAFIDPRRSQVDIVQAVGRAIRRAENKTVGTVVIPVFVDSDVDPEEALEASEFDRVWEVVRALRDHDVDLGEEIDELRRELGRRGSTGRRPRKIMLDIPTGIENAFASAFDTRLVEKTSARWEFWIGLLERYAVREGHCRPKPDHLEDGHRLGRWVVKQRSAHRKKRLTPERIEALSEMNGWAWSGNDERFLDGYEHLVRYVEEVGDASPPRPHATIDGFKLGLWVSTRRADYRANRVATQRIAMLESLPGWTWDPYEAEWEATFRALESFASREGHACPGGDQRLAGLHVGSWVRRQRQLRHALNADRKRRLEALSGWDWRTPLEVAWDDSLERLSEYLASGGGLGAVVATFRWNGFGLGRWVWKQRYEHTHGRLSPGRVACLEALPGWTWNTRKST